MDTAPTDEFLEVEGKSRAFATVRLSTDKHFCQLVRKYDFGLALGQELPS
jgi:hypothetical protein